MVTLLCFHCYTFITTPIQYTAISELQRTLQFFNILSQFENYGPPLILLYVKKCGYTTLFPLLYFYNHAHTIFLLRICKSFFFLFKLLFWNILVGHLFTIFIICSTYFCSHCFLFHYMMSYILYSNDHKAIYVCLFQHKSTTCSKDFNPNQKERKRIFELLNIQTPYFSV